MPTCRYMDFDSRYRDRTMFPNPADFEVQYTGSTNDPSKPRDPIAEAAAIYSVPINITPTQSGGDAVVGDTCINLGVPTTNPSQNQAENRREFYSCLIMHITDADGVQCGGSHTVTNYSGYDHSPFLPQPPVSPIDFKVTFETPLVAAEVACINSGDARAVFRKSGGQLKCGQAGSVLSPDTFPVAPGAGVTTIVLAASASTDANAYVGLYLYIVSAVGVQVEAIQVTAYDPTTLTVTLASPTVTGGPNYFFRADLPIFSGTVTAFTPGPPSTVTLSGTGVSTVDDAYNGLQLQIGAGDFALLITDYDGATMTATVTPSQAAGAITVADGVRVFKNSFVVLEGCPFTDTSLVNQWLQIDTFDETDTLPSGPLNYCWQGGVVPVPPATNGDAGIVAGVLYLFDNDFGGIDRSGYFANLNIVGGTITFTDPITNGSETYTITPDTGTDAVNYWSFTPVVGPVVVAPGIPTTGCPNVLVTFGYPSPTTTRLLQTPRQIRNYTSQIAELYLPLPNAYSTLDGYCVFPTSGDNWTPLNYNGSTLGQQEPFCHCLDLCELLIPGTQHVKCHPGGRVGRYAYLYVEVQAYSNCTDTIMASNNPHSRKALFKVGTGNDSLTPFYRLQSCTSQNIRFKPNDTFRIRILKPDGKVLEWSDEDNMSPLCPKDELQISMTIRYCRCGPETPQV